jgi:hypothetical protein
MAVVTASSARFHILVLVILTGFPTSCSGCRA